jgi:hypothetical protein
MSKKYQRIGRKAAPLEGSLSRIREQHQSTEALNWKSKATSYLLAHFGFIQGIASCSAGASKSGLAAEQWTY